MLHVSTLIKESRLPSWQPTCLVVSPARDAVRCWLLRLTLPRPPCFTRPPFIPANHPKCFPFPAGFRCKFEMNPPRGLKLKGVTVHLGEGVGARSAAASDRGRLWRNRRPPTEKPAARRSRSPFAKDVAVEFARSPHTSQLHLPESQTCGPLVVFYRIQCILSLPLSFLLFIILFRKSFFYRRLSPNINFKV